MIRVSLLLLCLVGLASAQSVTPTGIKYSFDHDGNERTYRLHVPDAVGESDGEFPLLLVLHGGGSDADVLSKSGWSELADQESFLVLYPNGLNGRWNDGRKVRKHAKQDAKTDDVAFLIQLLAELKAKHPIDPQRVYVAGLSNGGFMTQRLAIEHTEEFAAVAILIASLPKAYTTGALTFTPTAPLSVLFMNGTEDPFMPYEGGKLTPNLFPHLVDSATFDFGQDEAISTDDAVKLWVEHNGLGAVEPVVVDVPDTDKSDESQAVSFRWSDDESLVTVELIQVKGGGHTIPGGAQYLPERVIGKICRDFDGIEAVWRFFEGKPRGNTR